MKVKNQPVVIDAPTILRPEVNHTVALMDVVVTVKDPAGIRVMNYEVVSGEEVYISTA